MGTSVQANYDLETKQAFIEWYATPKPGREEGLKTEAQWGRAHNIPHGTLSQWKKQPWFREQIEAVYASLNISPERIQEVVEALWTAAAGGDTKAATLYLQYVERLAPKRVIVESRSVAEMSDEELKQALLDAANG